MQHLYSKFNGSHLLKEADFKQYKRVYSLENVSMYFLSIVSDIQLCYQLDLFALLCAGRTNWVHTVMNYVGPNEGQGIRVYNDGQLTASATTKNRDTHLPSDGRIAIGRFNARGRGSGEIFPFYASVEVDELSIFNRSLTEPEIIQIIQLV